MLHGIVHGHDRRRLPCAGAAGSSHAAHSDGMDAVVVASSISQIKELLPDYGDGFLLSCLRVCAPSVSCSMQLHTDTVVVPGHCEHLQSCPRSERRALR